MLRPPASFWPLKGIADAVIQGHLDPTHHTTTHRSIGPWHAGQDGADTTLVIGFRSEEALVGQFVLEKEEKER